MAQRPRDRAVVVDEKAENTFLISSRIAVSGWFSWWAIETDSCPIGLVPGVRNAVSKR
jgi:hypothetical protein